MLRLTSAGKVIGSTRGTGDCAELTGLCRQTGVVSTGNLVSNDERHVCRSERSSCTSLSTGGGKGAVQSRKSGPGSDCSLSSSCVKPWFVVSTPWESVFSGWQR